jgi:predicted nucleotidyltransferase component of viral defense system
MPFADVYRRQVALLIRILPLIAEEEGLALKGGTAINLFIRNAPRLSVDIDLTYVPVQPRPESLAAIDAALGRIIDRTKKSIRGAQIMQTRIEGVPAVKWRRINLDVLTREKRAVLVGKLEKVLAL